MVVGLLFHSSRLAWTGTDQTNHRSSGAARREAWCYRDRSVSRRSKLPQLSLYGIRTDVRIGRILRGRPSWNTSACLAPRIVQVAWSAADTRALAGAGDVSKRRILLGLIGANIMGSLSPALFADAFEAAGIDGFYHLMDVNCLPGRTLPKLLDAIKAAGFAGANITYPFKQDIIALLDAVDP